MRRKLTAVVLLLVVTCAFQCDPGTKRRAREISGDISQAIKAARLTTEELGEKHQISREEELALTTALLAINTGAKRFNSLVESSTSSRAALEAAITEILDGVSDLERTGVINIKDSEVRRKFQAIVKSLRVSVELAKALL